MNRALICLAADGHEARATLARRPKAEFVAQVIATMLRVPQTRARRRTEPAEAIAAYGMLARTPAPVDRMSSRCL